MTSYSVTVLPSRLHSLDALRGLAALAVVFWHWRHFFYIGSDLGEFDSQAQPFYAVFRPLYEHGALAVDLFFGLSGFVFFWLYSQAIATKYMGARQFSVLRFSRLYPLHIATFVAVLILQMVAQARLGEPFVYPWNDWYHAVLNILLIPAWGLEEGWSFNGPIWSVSIEVLLYVLFFMTLRLVRHPSLVCMAYIGLGLALGSINYKIATGLIAFFSGGLGFLLTYKLLAYHSNKTTFIVLAALNVVGFIYIYAGGRNQIAFDMAVFPIIIATLATIQSFRPNWLRGWAFLGQLSYSTYLIHFPLQLTFVLIAASAGLNRSIFYTNAAFIAFFLTLIILSLCSYRFFETPLQRYLRRKLLARNGPLTPN